MPKGRLEAFSDGVIAILITIMVLELHVPSGSGVHALRPVVPVFFTYLLSFVYLGIYWNNHHHMLHAMHRTNGTPLAFAEHWVSVALYIVVAGIWLVPDKRIESRLVEGSLQ